jgi:hypothetical protein
MTLIALIAVSHRDGLHRVGGAILIGPYLVLLAVVIALWR